MAVLIPNTQLALARASNVRDDFGARKASVIGDTSQALPGTARERADGTWTLGLDPTLWPVRKDDHVVELHDDGSEGRRWIVTTAQHNTNPEDPDIDWIRCQALQQTAAGIEPGGAQFAGRD